MNEVVFLTAWAPFESDRRRLGITALAERYRVTIADLSPLLAPQHSSGEPPGDTVRIESYPQLDAFLREKQNAVFCDYVLGRSPLMPRQAPLFRALARNGIRYFVVSAAELPAASGGSGGVLRKAISRLRSSDGIFSYAAGVAAKGVIARLRGRGFYARPERIYAVDCLSAQKFAEDCGIGPQAVCPVNSLDYSAFLEAKSKGLTISDSGTCVLIDEGLVDSRDFSYAGLRPLSSEKYYPLMNAFLEAVENQLGLEVLVAVHPKADPAERSGRYGRRKTVQGRTLEAVASASLVLAHWSTAINFAVLCGKPLLLLKSEEMLSKGLSRFVDNMSAALGARAVLMEDCLVRPLDFSPGSLPGERYADYMTKYIRSERAGECGTWDGVSEDLAKVFRGGCHGS